MFCFLSLYTVSGKIINATLTFSHPVILKPQTIRMLCKQSVMVTDKCNIAYNCVVGRKEDLIFFHKEKCKNALL